MNTFRGAYMTYKLRIQEEKLDDVWFHEENVQSNDICRRKEIICLRQTDIRTSN